MGRAIITDAGVATIAAGPVLTAATAGSNSTFTVRNQDLNSNCYLSGMWRKGTAAGQIRLTSPNLVPVSNGIFIDTPAGLSDSLLPRMPEQRLIPQDDLTIELNGTAANVDLAAIQTYYENLPGVSQVLKMPGDIAGMIDYILGWPVACTSSATEGDQNETVITTTVDSSSANRWYALLGILTDVDVGCVGLKGVDTSNTFIGAPGDSSAFRNRNYFQDLSMDTGRPSVPLFNAANKANTNIVLADNGASTAVNVTMILAQMVESYKP